MTTDLKLCPNPADHMEVLGVVDTSVGRIRGTQVECSTCGMMGPWCGTRDDAVSGWNALPRRMGREEAEMLVSEYQDAVIGRDEAYRGGTDKDIHRAEDLCADTRAALLAALTGEK